MAGASRQRHRGMAEMRELFSEFATKPYFVTYPEGLDAKLRTDLLVTQRSFIQAAYRILPVMSLVQKEAEKVLVELHEDKKGDPGWNLPEGEVKKWSQKVALQVRTMLRHVQQSRLKKVQAPWIKLLQLPPSTDPEEKGADEEESAKATEDQDESSPVKEKTKNDEEKEVHRAGWGRKERRGRQWFRE